MYAYCHPDQYFLIRIHPYLFMRNLYQILLKHLKAGESVVLASVTQSSGSTPQKSGSSAIYGINGLLIGTVGGGLVEGEITEIAKSAIQNNTSAHLHFNLDDEESEKGAICGGEISVLVDGDPGKHLDAFERLDYNLSQKKPGGLLTIIDKNDKDHETIRRFWIDPEKRDEFPTEINSGLKSEILEKLCSGKYSHPVSFPLQNKTRQTFVLLEPVFPLPSLVIAGAGHVGKAVAHLGHILDFEVTVIDDRPEFANQDNLPDADHIILGDIGKSMRDANIDSDTYVVIVTRGHRHDADTLRECIGLKTAYTGMIGSANKVGTLKKKFLSGSWATSEQWEKIHAPIGLKIGSKTVAEIAVSIAAELIQVRMQKNSKS